MLTWVASHYHYIKPPHQGEQAFCEQLNAVMSAFSEQKKRDQHYALIRKITQVYCRARYANLSDQDYRLAIRQLQMLVKTLKKIK